MSLPWTFCHSPLESHHASSLQGKWHLYRYLSGVHDNLRLLLFCSVLWTVQGKAELNLALAGRGDGLPMRMRRFRRFGQPWTGEPSQATQNGANETRAHASSRTKKLCLLLELGPRPLRRHAQQVRTGRLHCSVTQAGCSGGQQKCTHLSCCHN